MSDLRKLAELRERATEGPWQISERLGKDEAWCDWHRVGPFDLMGGNADDDDRYISACGNLTPARLRELAAMEGRQQWRPIESAPKDQTEFLASHNSLSYVSCWIAGRVVTLPGRFAWNPTHWMPLPPPIGASTSESVEAMTESGWEPPQEVQRLKDALRQIEQLTWGGKGESAVHIIASQALAVPREMPPAPAPPAAPELIDDQTPMPKQCTRWECKAHGSEQVLENRNGFMVCPACGFSYGAAPACESEPVTWMCRRCRIGELPRENGLIYFIASEAKYGVQFLHRTREWCDFLMHGGMWPDRASAEAFLRELGAEVQRG